MMYKSQLRVSRHVIELRIGMVISEIKGVTQKLGVTYSLAPVFLVKDLRIIQQTISDEAGNYIFKNVIKGQSYTVFSRDLNKQYNAVIQDNVVPV